MKLAETTWFKIYNKDLFGHHDAFITFEIVGCSYHVCRRNFYKVFPSTRRNKKNKYKLVVYSKKIKNAVKVEQFKLGDYNKPNGLYFIIDDKCMDVTMRVRILLNRLLKNRKYVYVQLKKS